MLPIADSPARTAEMADLIEGVAGEWSPFEERHGFSIDGVDLGTAVPPRGWRDRLVRVQNANTAAPSGQPQYIGWCLHAEDLCVPKLCAHREKDLNFVRALHDAGLIDAAVIAARLLDVEAQHQQTVSVALGWLASLPAPVTGGPILEVPPITASADREGPPGPPWERVTPRRIDGAEHQRRTPPQGRPLAGPLLGR